MILHLFLLFSLTALADSNCATNTFVSSRIDVPDEWCQTNCEAALDYCLDTGFCHCSTDMESTTETDVISTTDVDVTIVDIEVPVSTTSPDDTSEHVRLCYFSNWARYRPNAGADVFEMGFDPTLCTHINYGFGTIDPNTFELKAFDPWADHPNGAESQTTACPSQCVPGYVHDWSSSAVNPCQYPCGPDRQLRGFEGLTVGLKRQNPNLKAILSVGGWNFNNCEYTEISGQGRDSCEIFSTIASSESNIRRHAQHVIAFLRGWGFDGYDIDWEYPVKAGHNRLNGDASPEDYDNYIEMLRILRQEFELEAQATGKARLLLTVAVGVGESTAEQAYNIPLMNTYLDLIGLMTYDFHGDWEIDGTNFNSPLYSNAEDLAYYDYDMSSSWAVDYWLSHGIDANKLLLGFATYGRGWKLQDLSCQTAHCPVNGAADAGAFTELPGYLSYYEIESLINNGGVRYFDDERKVPYVITASGDWIGYDDLESFNIKTDYLKSKNLRGAIVWAIDLDDLNNGYPLLNELKSGLAGYTLDETTTATTGAPTHAPTPAQTDAPALFDCKDNSDGYNCWGEAGIAPADCTTIRKWYMKTGRNEPWASSVTYLADNWMINVDGMTLKQVKSSFVDFCL